MRARFPDADVRLIDSSGGAFEVSVDGAVVFSKLRLGRHAHEGEIVRLIDAHAGGAT